MPPNNGNVYLGQLQAENERLKRRNAQLEERTQALLVLQELATALVAEMERPALLRKIVAAAIRVTAAQRGVLYLHDPDQGLLGVVAREPVGDTAQSRPAIPLGEGVAGKVGATGESILVANAAADTRFSAEELAPDRDVIGGAPTSVLAVALIHDNIITGVLEVAKEGASDVFDTWSMELLRLIAAQAAVAVANEGRFAAERVVEQQAFVAQEAERRRLMRALEAGPAQALTQLARSLDYATQVATRDPSQLAPDLRALRERADGITRELRSQLFDASPAALADDGAGLVAALDSLLASVADRLTFHREIAYTTPLPREVERRIFAIVQEAVDNALEHASASACWVTLRESEAEVVVIVRDDGVGFDVKKTLADYSARGSGGLLGIWERARLIGAKATVSSQLGKGAQVALEVAR